MGNVLKVSLSDLDNVFLDDLRKKVGDADVTIHLPDGSAFKPLTEKEFWQLIDLLDWSDVDNEVIVKPVVKTLSEMPVFNIYRFEDILSEKLWYLDTKEHAEATADWKALKSLSSDGFLYDRCSVIANGEEFYNDVSAHPEKMPKNLSFEPLLNIASKSYEMKTGKAFTHITAYSYETHSNELAW
jgi:Protein of unknown function (DUF4240)